MVTADIILLSVNFSIKKNRCKVKPDKVKDSFNIKTSPKDEDNVQSDSAYDTSTTKFVSW